MTTTDGIGDGPSIQEPLYPRLPCFDCGPNNPKACGSEATPVMGRDSGVHAVT
jgi:hypothetical protein